MYGYRIKNVDEGYVGIYLDFGGCGLSLIVSDQCLSIVEG